MSEDEPLGLVERVHLIATTVEAVCGRTDDPQISAMRAVTFCLALNFHMATETDQTERAHNLVRQVSDMSGCTGEELAVAVGLFAMRAQDALQEEIVRVQREREREAADYNRLVDQVVAIEEASEETSQAYTTDVHAAEVEQARLHGALGVMTKANKALARRDRRRRSELFQLTLALRDRNETITELRAELAELKGEEE